MQKVLEIIENSKKSGGDYYGDFYHNEYVLSSLSVRCDACNEEVEIDSPDGGTAEDIEDYSFECPDCGGKWKHIKDDLFEITNAEEIEYEG